MRVLFSLAVLFVNRSAVAIIHGNDDIGNDNDTTTVMDLHGGGRHLSVEKTWFLRLKQMDETGLVKRCYKRTVAPESGMACGRKSKICFFGDQECPSSVVGLLHPTTKCSCDNNVWNCEDELCPANEATCVGSVEATNGPNCPSVTSYKSLLLSGLPCPKVVDQGTVGSRRMVEFFLADGADYRCDYDAIPYAELCLRSPYYPGCGPIKWGCQANGCCPTIVCFCKNGALACEGNGPLPYDISTSYPSGSPT